MDKATERYLQGDRRESIGMGWEAVYKGGTLLRYELPRSEYDKPQTDGRWRDILDKLSMADHELELNGPVFIEKSFDAERLKQYIAGKLPLPPGEWVYTPEGKGWALKHDSQSMFPSVFCHGELTSSLGVKSDYRDCPAHSLIFYHVVERPEDIKLIADWHRLHDQLSKREPLVTGTVLWESTGIEKQYQVSIEALDYYFKFNPAAKDRISRSGISSLTKLADHNIYVLTIDKRFTFDQCKRDLDWRLRDLHQHIRGGWELDIGNSNIRIHKDSLPPQDKEALSRAGLPIKVDKDDYLRFELKNFVKVEPRLSHWSGYQRNLAKPADLSMLPPPAVNPENAIVAAGNITTSHDRQR